LADDISLLLTKMRGCTAAAEINPIPGPKQSLKQVRKLLEGEFPKHIEEIVEKINLLEDTKNSMDKNIQSTLIASKLATLNLDLELLSDYETLSCWVGEFEDLAGLSDKLELISESICFTDGNTKKGVAAIFCEKEVTEIVQPIISESNFDPITLPENSGSAKTLINSLQKENEKSVSTIEKLENELKNWSQEHGENLLACMELLERDLEILNAPVRVAVSEHAFVMDGWIPTSSVKESSVALKMVSTIVETEIFEQSHSHGNHHENQEELPPIAFTERNISKPFELLTDLIGRPKYGRVDPTTFMLFTYPIFFGMMLGDIAYGFITIALGLWIKNKFPDNDSAILASKLVVYIGISCAIFGLLYGEIFGFEVAPSYDHGGDVAVDSHATESAVEGHAVPAWLAWMSALYPQSHALAITLPFNLTFAYPFHRIGHNMSDLIIISIYLGIIHLALGFLIGIRDVAREQGWTAAFLEKGSWLLVLSGGFLACYGYVAGKNEGWSDAYASILSDLMLYGGITLGIGVVCVTYGLMKYHGHGAISLFLGPLETISLFSNTLSYIRLMAIGVVGAKIAEVGNIMGYENMIHAFDEAFTHGDITAIFIGIACLFLWIGVQIFALVLGIFSPNIHAARLHFVEWMKQFYDGSGKPFKPFGSKSKLVEVE